MENNNWNWYENATPNTGNFNTQQPAGGNGGGNKKERNLIWILSYRWKIKNQAMKNF